MRDTGGGGVRVWLHSFGGWWSTPCPDRCSAGTHCRGGWMSPRGGLNGYVEEKLLFPLASERWAVRTVASRHTNWDLFRWKPNFIKFIYISFRGNARTSTVALCALRVFSQENVPSIPVSSVLNLIWVCHYKRSQLCSFNLLPATWRTCELWNKSFSEGTDRRSNVGRSIRTRSTNFYLCHHVLQGLLATRE
jgi:hypothetical protein